MKYSFLMPYKNRQGQLHNTLLSFKHWYGERNDWEVVLLIDGTETPHIPFCADRVRVSNIMRPEINPAPLFNICAGLAQGEYLVITNPECYHAANILQWFDFIFETDDYAYAVAACDAVAYPGMLHWYKETLGPFDMRYQHSVERNLRYHFCSGISKLNYYRIGGFDEAFAEGYCFDDDDFRDKVLYANLHCYTDDSMLVLHQAHSKYPMTRDLKKMWERNKSIYENNVKLRQL